MSDIASVASIRAQAVGQSNGSHFGIAMMVVLAFASAVIAFQHPGMIGLEYQSVDQVLLGR